MDAYPSEHYEYWREALPEVDYPWGAFGENLTTAGLLETFVRIGDQFRMGSAELVVTEPRFPCFKLGIRFDRSDMVRRFAKSGRTGFYLAVIHEGELAAGDPIELTASRAGLTVADVAHQTLSNEEESE